jgi:hypothetical protein
MQINFKANYIDSVPLKHNKQGAFIEINPNSDKDLLAVKKVAEAWSTKFTEGIFYGLYGCHNTSDNKTKFFAITGQVDNLEELNPSAILAIMETHHISNRQIKINLLQVNPLNKKEGIGTSMINCLKGVTSCKEILTHPVEDAMNFYYKLGFRPRNGLLNWILKVK